MAELGIADQAGLNAVPRRTNLNRIKEDPPPEHVAPPQEMRPGGTPSPRRAALAPSGRPWFAFTFAACPPPHPDPPPRGGEGTILELSPSWGRVGWGAVEVQFNHGRVLRP